MQKDKLLPMFFDLLGAAHSASDEVDNYDLVSEIEESKQKFEMLCGIETTSCRLLIDFILEHSEELKEAFDRKGNPGGL